ncbi:hypothetical protein DAEQUDRAFT_598040 [Daedalea quercina L-15889]|uniref:Uncharacterized protein n=1 Tax=Daedalea quercina L-15889 TaxID=1314783 RepID=A0A165LP99_9APHY|nr:hypothetical protein DAEQUDRAFT_598040 [Daedalea quercina L-15889]
MMMSSFTKGLGCLFVGVTGSVALFGITVAQVFYYLWNYREDRCYLKAFVLTVCLLDVASTIFNADVPTLTVSRIRGMIDQPLSSSGFF